MVIRVASHLFTGGFAGIGKLPALFGWYIRYGIGIKVVLTNAANSIRSPYLRGYIVLPKSLPSFRPISVNYVPRKYRPIANRNTDLRCNSNGHGHNTTNPTTQ